MSRRFEDGPITLRLFDDQRSAMSAPGAHTPTYYGCGWLARDEFDRWIDADGVIPSDWQPDPVHLHVAPV